MPAGDEDALGEGCGEQASPNWFLAAAQTGVRRQPPVTKPGHLFGERQGGPLLAVEAAMGPATPVQAQRLTDA